ncbi:MAG: GNAT family N-acetyltransferase [Bacillota bacterium]
MYRIQAIESMEAIQALRTSEGACSPMPSVGAWFDPNHVSLIAVGPEGPAGGVLLTPCRHVGPLVTKYRLEWLYVLPEHRNRGLGRKLTQAAAAEASKRGASTILIAVKPENQRGLSWSEGLPKVAGLGFVVALDRCGL